MGKVDCVLVVSKSCCDPLRGWWCNVRGRGAKLVVMWLSLQPPSGSSIFFSFFPFLTLNRSSRFPGHRLPDHCKAVHFKQWPGHDVIACNAEEYKWAVCLEISPSILCQTLLRSFFILRSTCLLIASQKTLKCSTMQNAPANISPFYKTMYCLQIWNNPFENIYDFLNSSKSLQHLWAWFQKIIIKKKSSNTQSGQFLVTHIENQADKMHNISFSNSLGCGNCFALIRSSIQDIMQRTRIHPNRQMHTSSSPIKMLRLLLNCDK